MSDAHTGFVERLVREQGQALRSFLLRRLRVKSQAPDLAQGIYLRLLRIEDVDAIRDPRLYLFTVASNLLKEHGMQEQRRDARRALLDDDALQALPGDDVPADSALDRERRLERLRVVLDELPQRWRHAVILQYRYGLTYAEIGAELGVSSNMVKKYLAQALARCRRRAFFDWLRTSPLHVREYLGVAGVAAELRTLLQAQPAPPLHGYLAQVRAADPAPVAELPLRNLVLTRTEPHWHPSRWLAVAATVLVVLSGLALWEMREGERFGLPRTLETQHNASSVTTLPDGSIVQLDTSSRLVVRFSRSERRFDLVAGQVYVRVAAGDPRSFHTGRRGSKSSTRSCVHCLSAARSTQLISIRSSPFWRRCRV